MSDEKIDVLAVMDGLCEVADEHQDEGPSGCGWASDKLSKLRAVGPEARTALAKLIESCEKMDRGLIEPDDHKRQGIFTFQRADVEAFRAALNCVRSS